MKPHLSQLCKVRITTILERLHLLTDGASMNPSAKLTRTLYMQDNFFTTPVAQLTFAWTLKNLSVSWQINGNASCQYATVKVFEVDRGGWWKVQARHVYDAKVDFILTGLDSVLVSIEALLHKGEPVSTFLGPPAIVLLDEFGPDECFTVLDAETMTNAGRWSWGEPLQLDEEE